MMSAAVWCPCNLHKYLFEVSCLTRWDYEVCLVLKEFKLDGVNLFGARGHKGFVEGNNGKEKSYSAPYRLVCANFLVSKAYLGLI